MPRGLLPRRTGPKVATAPRRSLALPLLPAVVALSAALGIPAAGGASFGTPIASVTTVAGAGSPGVSPSGTLARKTLLDDPTGIAVDGAGDLFLADTGNCRIDEVRGGAPGKHRLTRVAGDSCTGAPFDNGRPARTTNVGFARGVAVDAVGDLFIADTSGNRVLEVPATGGQHFGLTMTAGHLYTVAGTGAAGFSGEGRPGPQATLDAPVGVAVDGAGDVFIADTANCRVREIPAVSTTRDGGTLGVGHIYTVAGTGSCGTPLGAGVDGDGGPALSAQVWTPSSVAVDSAGDLFISDRGNDEVREVPTASGTYFGVAIGAGDIATIAGSATGYSPYLVDGLSATGATAELNFVSGIALDPSGDLFIADGYSRALREVPDRTGLSFGRPVTADEMYTLAGALPSGPIQDQSRWILTRVTYPNDVAVAPGGVLYFSDPGANVVRSIRPVS